MQRQYNSQIRRSFSAAIRENLEEFYTDVNQITVTEKMSGKGRRCYGCAKRDHVIAVCPERQGKLFRQHEKGLCKICSTRAQMTASVNSAEICSAFLVGMAVTVLAFKALSVLKGHY